MAIEKVQNGSFETDTKWKKGNNWTISGGKANVAVSGSGSLWQNIDAIEGSTYTVIFTMAIVSWVPTISVNIGGGTGVSETTAATHTNILTAGNNGRITFSASGTGTATIDNVSCQLLKPAGIWGRISSILGRLRYIFE